MYLYKILQRAFKQIIANKSQKIITELYINNHFTDEKTVHQRVCEKMFNFNKERQANKNMLLLILTYNIKDLFCHCFDDGI